MKAAHELAPNFAPVYAAALYPELAKLMQSHGYALAVHGSLARDMDLIAVPWAERSAPIADVLKAIEGRFAFKPIGEPEPREHGRFAHTYSIGFGECAIDLSFFPSCEGSLSVEDGQSVRQTRWAIVQGEDGPDKDYSRFIGASAFDAIAAFLFDQWQSVDSAIDRACMATIEAEWESAQAQGWRCVEVELVLVKGAQ